MLVIDTSGSMGASGMSTVRSATRAYLKEAPADVLIGVVTFANTAGVDLKPTADRAAVQRVVDGLDARGDTSLYAAVKAATGALPANGDRSIVLLSDGADTVSKNRQRDLAAVNAELKQRGVRVDVVRFNTDDPDAVVALRGFAGASGGSVISAKNAEDVGAAFQSAARSLQSQAEFKLKPSTPLRGSHTVTISGTAGDEPFKATQTVNFGAAPPPAGATPPPAIPAQAAPPALRTFTMQQSVMPWVAAGTIGLAIMLLAVGVLTPTLQTRREQRIASLDQYVGETKVVSRSQGKHEHVPLAEQFVNLGERAMRDRSSTARTMELINRADLPLRAGEWWVLRVVAVVAATAIGMVVVGGSPLLGGAIGALLGFVLPHPGASLPGIAPRGRLRASAARRAHARGDQPAKRVRPAAGPRRSGHVTRPSPPPRSSPGPSPRPGSAPTSRMRSSAWRPDGQQVHALGGHGDPDPARGRRQPRRDARDHGHDLARARVAASAGPRAVRRGPALGLHPHRAADRHLLLHDEGQLRVHLACCGRPTRDRHGVIGGIVLLVVGIFWMRKVVQIEV